MQFRYLFVVFCKPFAYLLLPLSNRDFSITADRAMLEGKRDFLSRLKDLAAGEESADRRPPNILIILADDLGKTDVSL